MNSANTGDHQQAARGYVEGYYGKLLSWSARGDLVKCLASLQLNTYCYAPKEDPQHRLQWRKPYSAQWHSSFRELCTFANNSEVSVIAGIAPGLDFNFDNSEDSSHLQRKATEFLNDGASGILVLWDDIEKSSPDAFTAMSEGAAHAHTVNNLADTLGRPLWTVPRVYASEIERNSIYQQDFFAELNPQHTVLLCGYAIVSGSISPADFLGTIKPEHRIIVWDNFYANDYCPRRLFLGPWTGREAINEYLLNPTGMPYTDQLLLDIALSTQNSNDKQADWLQALKRHKVPEIFQTIAPYFNKPFFGDRKVHGNSSDLDCIEDGADVDDAIEECLWRWKSPLAREWYPFIMGLKHDLALMRQTLPRDRILKTQSPQLAKRLLD